MKLNKTAAAIALAGIAAAPMAQAQVTLTGSVGIQIGGSDAEDIPAVTDPTTGEVTPGSSPGDLAISADDSVLNIAASHEMNNGLTAYGNYRTDFGLTGSAGAADNIAIGVKGDFGDIKLGEVPDAIEYGQVAGDALTDIGGENAGLSYTGTFGSATVGLNWSPENNSDRVGGGVKFAVGGFSIGVGAGSAGGDSLMSVGASFALGGASVALAFKDFDNDNSAVGAKASWGAGDLGLALTFEQEDGDPNGSGAADDSVIRLDADYDLGGDMAFNFRVNALTSDNGDVTSYRVLFTKSF